jgi:Nitrate/TMAO reductases, membrane-bound tetraheme cytochrome c subunit
MERIKRFSAWIWKVLSTPAATLSLAFLTLGGFVGGVIFWGAFNTALEITNTEAFCVSCHEMETNVYEELTRTVHFSNRSGVRASHEWARLKANDSLECRNCHSSVAMDLSKQTERAAEIHTRYLLSGRATCIDCHKGIAHELPNMRGVEPGWQMPDELEGEVLPSASAIDQLRKAMDQAHLGVARVN